ncbi:MAG: peptidase C69 [Deltaproteobacteria bacterium GWC2_42_11]|nr:MAG: peptidase C69 [Deltaproteobacteria bacterium GWC2_42_11]HBO83420.1 peptidase C69 [Deltaproteobacteria bacterium]
MELLKCIDPLPILKKALKNGGDFADIYFEETVNTSVICEENRIEKIIAGIDKGCGIRVIFNHKTAYAYTNDLSQKGLAALAETVSHAVKNHETGKDISVINKSISNGFFIKIPPDKTLLPEKVDIVNRANKIAWGMDKRIRQVKVIYGDGTREMAVINSEGEWVEDRRTSLLFAVSAVAQEGEILQTGYEPIGGISGMEIFDELPPEKIAETAGKRAITMLKARRAPGGKMSVVLSSEAGGTMIHEAIGHGLEADLAQQGLSVYSNKIGEKVASDLITVIDDATIPNKRGSYFFDDEGTRGQKTVLVENGILKNYMYDRLTAMKDKKQSTGNGRRESYHHRPIPRMTNTYIAAGKTDPEDIISSVENGLLVKKMGGGQVNTVNGDFVFEVTEGYLIENGKVTEPIRGATLTGSGPSTLRDIDMVGSDLGFGIGTCGKDTQGVPVSDAQPTLRIPEIVIGGDVSK